MLHFPSWTASTVPGPVFFWSPETAHVGKKKEKNMNEYNVNNFGKEELEMEGTYSISGF